MENLLTDREFWVKHWESKTNLSVHIPEKYLFSAELKDLVQKENLKTAIELGGFPGYFTVYLKKYLHLDVTLLDYFVHPPITNELLTNNGLNAEDIHTIETDLFKYLPEQQYDLVLSFGLIEHFKDTIDIIRRHVAFLKPGGILFITLPNFKAVNGWFQKKFDRDNYDIHNIDSMDLELLTEICKELGLVEIKAAYYGRFSLWLEKENEKPAVVRLLKKVLWFGGKVLTTILPFNSRQFSPHIILTAKKN